MATRFQSADKTLRVEIGPGGVIVTIDGHEWHWVVSGVDSSLHPGGTFVSGFRPSPDDPLRLKHVLNARRPEECRDCRPYLIPRSMGAGVNQREAGPCDKNVSGVADRGESGARGDRAASSPAPTSSKR